MRYLMRLILVAVVFLVPVTSAQAERVLRLNEVAVGELDPHIALDYIDSILLVNLYDPLVRPKSGGGFLPGLAESWEVSDDNMSITFTVQSGIKFHDGSDVNADDVIYSFDRNKALGMGYAYLFANASMAKTSDMEAVLTLSTPDSSILAALTRLGIVNSDLVKANQGDGDFGANGDYGAAYLSANDAGSGAYQVVSHNMQELTVLSKFSDHYGGFLPKSPDTIRVIYVMETATIRALMSNKEHEITAQWHPGTMFAGLAAEDGLGLTTEDGIAYLVMPIHTAKAPTDDVHVRRAMIAATDYEQMVAIEKVTEELTAANRSRTALPAALSGYDASAPLFDQDLEAAKAHLAKSKYADNIGDYEVEIAWIAEVPKEEKIAFLLAHNLSQIGMKAKVVKVPWAVYSDRVTKLETTPHVGQLYFSATYPDPLSLLGAYHSRVRGSYSSHDWLDDSEVDRLIDAATAEMDDSKKNDLLIQLQRRLIDVGAAIYAYETRALFAKQDYVSAPFLDDPTNTVAMMGGNWRFNTWEVDN